jgi:hypothetical protein
MANWCRILTAALFVVHLMVGCCAHHAHACHSDHSSSPAQNEATAHDPCAGASGCVKGHAPHGLHGCQEVTCSFIHSANRFLADRSSFQIDQTSAVPLVEEDASLLGVSCTGQFFSASSDGLIPPVPLHLLHQIFLI